MNEVELFKAELAAAKALSNQQWLEELRTLLLQTFPDFEPKILEAVKQRKPSVTWELAATSHKQVRMLGLAVQDVYGLKPPIITGLPDSGRQWPFNKIAVCNFRVAGW